MTSIYEVFKTILGAIIAGFVLYFLVYYAGIYSGIQEDTMRFRAMKNFNTLLEDVYLTGNPSNFESFGGRLEFTPGFEPTPPAGLMSELGKNAFPVTTLYSPGEELFVSSGYLDLGWWKFRYVIAMPETKIVFNNLEGTPESWQLVRSIVERLPSSTGFSPKITYGLCDGTAVTGDVCGVTGTDPCEREYFLISIKQPSAASSVCRRGLAGMRIVTISSECSPTFADDVCIEPPAGSIGMAYLTGSSKEYLYHDALDLAALIVGGSGSSIYGVAGENLWKYKNAAFAREMRLAATMVSQSSLLGTRTFSSEASKGTLSRDSEVYKCAAVYQTLSGTVTEIGEILEDPDYYISTTDTADLNSKMEEAKTARQELVSLGCEYIIV